MHMPVILNVFYFFRPAEISAVFPVFRRLSGDKTAVLTRVSAGLRMSLQHQHGQSRRRLRVRQLAYV